MSGNYPNSMLFFIVEVKASTLASLFDLRPTYGQFEVALVSNQGYFYSAPSHWNITSSNVLDRRVYDMKNVSGLDQAAFVQLKTSNYSEVTRLDSGGNSTLFALTNSLLPEDYKSSFPALENAVLGGTSLPGTLGLQVLVYISQASFKEAAGKAQKILVNDLIGQILTVVAYSILFINYMAGFVYLVKKVLVNRLGKLDRSAELIFAMDYNEPPEVKASVFAEVKASLEQYPEEYEEMFREFTDMCQYIINSKVNFVRKDRVVAYSPNKFSKELLKDQAQEVTIYKPQLQDD